MQYSNDLHYSSCVNNFLLGRAKKMIVRFSWDILNQNLEYYARFNSNGEF